MELYLFALLPLGLASLFSRRLPRSTAGFGFLAALAPVLAQGALNLFKGKAASSEAKKKAAYDKQVAEAQAEADRRKWEAEQNTGQNLAQRQAFTMKLGRLAGAMGGVDKLPPSIMNYLQSQRKAREYVPGANYVEAPRAGGGGWNIGLGIADALSYLDTSKLGRTPKINSNLMSAGNAAASRGGLGALQGGGPATSILGDYLARQKTQAPAQIALSSGQKITPFDPKFGRG